jgi:hypothetical protein
MSTSFRTSFRLEQAPEQVFDAICDVRSWWSGQIDGRTDVLGEEFGYTVPGVHFSRQRVTGLDRASRVVWLVVDSRLEYLQDEAEWDGTTISFDLVERAGGTELTFTHEGLVPEVECYDQCTSFWGSVVLPDLRRRIAALPAPAR